MRFEDERYVRLYTRDTLNWRRLGWQGQSVLPNLMRKVDRAGVLDIGDVPPAEAIALVINFPQEVVEVAWANMIKTGTVTFCDGRVVLPNFLEAQEAISSDAERKRKSRELARILPSVTNRDTQSQIVSKSHAESHAVTRGHAVSRAVTPSLAVPSSTDLECSDQKPLVSQRQNADAAPPASDLSRYLTAEWPDIRPDKAASLEASAKDAYPSVDLLAEAKKARAFEASKKIPYTDHARFVRHWWSEAQDRLAKAAPRGAPGSAPLKAGDWDGQPTGRRLL